jgi:hypothetical protein
MSKSFSIYVWNGMTQGVVHGGRAWSFTDLVKLHKRSMVSVRTVVKFRYFHSYTYMYPAYLAGVGLITYSLPSSYAKAEDASSESDIRKATAQLVSSATKLRISVEDRRLSLDVSG